MNDIKIGVTLLFGALACLIGGFWLGTFGTVAGFASGALFTVGAAYLHSAKVA